MDGEGQALICFELQWRGFETVSLAKEEHSMEQLGDGTEVRGVAEEAL